MACSNHLRFVAAISCRWREPVTIVRAKFPHMRARALCLIVLLASSVPAFAADARGEAKKHVEFGVVVAQKGLWREAILQWERAVAIDPTYAAAFNDLGIAYEHEGDLDKARTAYEKALAIEPNNAYIKQNYELFKEINDRTTRTDAK
jgi:Flp pilus assembly protein TadD